MVIAEHRPGLDPSTRDEHTLNAHESTFRSRDGPLKVTASTTHPAGQTTLVTHVVNTRQATPDNVREVHLERRLAGARRDRYLQVDETPKPGASAGGSCAIVERLSEVVRADLKDGRRQTDGGETLADEKPFRAGANTMREHASRALPRPAGRRVGYVSRTASASMLIVTLSLTTAPPPSMAAFQLTPKSVRLISAVALNPARFPP